MGVAIHSPNVSLLQAIKLRKTFSGRLVVDDVSFVVNPREIVGLLGRNGAGKTTSFRMTIGMIDPDPGPDSGRVLFNDTDVSNQPMYRRARLGMGYLSQEPSIFQRMTVEQNLLAILETLSLSRDERRKRASGLLEQFGLTHKAKHQARTCSGGERRKLEIARALVTRPKLILLDEPFSGVDPIAVEDLQTEIRRLAETGIAFLITDHNVQQTLRVCDRAYILDNGRVFAEGTPRDLINDEMVRRVYLGSLFRGDEFDDHHAPRGKGGVTASASASGAAPSPRGTTPTAPPVSTTPVHAPANASTPKTGAGSMPANGQPTPASKPPTPRAVVNPSSSGAPPANPPAPRR
ncbi:MAG: LPS export ABC transporter ATP-binding protein [Phycisphaerae bacterium]|nr:LPS export ABC transporter ATP-binding protein [Phycisphaerae bacterium]